MKIGVISDTHGSQKMIQQVVKKAGDVELWLHAGDHSQDADYLIKLTGVPVIAVKGNCDGHTAAKLDEFLEVKSKKIWLTHGHRYGVKEGYSELIWWSREYKADIVVYGHTHVPDNQWEDDLLIFNPGSTTYPRFGYGTFGIIDIDPQDNVAASIVELKK